MIKASFLLRAVLRSGGNSSTTKYKLFVDYKKIMQELYNAIYFLAVSLIRFSGLVQLREVIKSAGRRTRCGVWE